MWGVGRKEMVFNAEVKKQEAEVKIEGNAKRKEEVAKNKK